MNISYNFITPKSNHLLDFSVYLYDVQDTLEPSHLIFFLYSKRHNRQPRNVVPNNVFSILGIPAVKDAKNDF